MERVANTEYLISAANTIVEILDATSDPSAKDLKKALVLGCNTLRRPAEDKDFFVELETAAKRKRENEKGFQSVIGEVGHFVKFFLPGEKKALEKAKVSKGAVKTLLKAAEGLRETLKQASDSQDIRVGINKLRNETCSVADELEEVVLRQEQVRQRKALLRRVFYVVGGAAVIIIDSVPDFVVAGGLTPVGQAISGELGKGIMGMGFQ